MKTFRFLLSLLVSLALATTNVAVAAGTHCNFGETSTGPTSAHEAGHHAFGHQQPGDESSANVSVESDKSSVSSTKQISTASASCSHCAYCQSCVTPSLEPANALLAPSDSTRIVRTSVTDRVTANDADPLFRPPRSHSA